MAGDLVHHLPGDLVNLNPFPGKQVFPTPGDLVILPIKPVALC
jgi:hypothetical protein